jgi:hypothetical protein
LRLRDRDFLAAFLGRIFGSLLGFRGGKNQKGEKARDCKCPAERREAEMESQDCLKGSLGRGRRSVKRCLR